MHGSIKGRVSEKAVLKEGSSLDRSPLTQKYKRDGLKTTTPLKKSPKKPKTKQTKQNETNPHTQNKVAVKENWSSIMIADS